MLMADFVKQTDIEPTHISKGVRALSGTRDVFYNSANAFAENTNIEDGYVPFGYEAVASNNSSGSTSAKLPFFGTNAISLIQDSTQAHTIDFAGSTDVAKTALDSSVNYKSDGYSINADATLGLNEVTTNIIAGGWGWQGYYLATPIHTSHHYQPFETPFLHELVGGDRNMEQNNLVCSPDGKTWDEVTRDTSYLNNLVISASRDGGNVTDTIFIFDWWRGNFEDNKLTSVHKKHWAISYDRIICLIEGTYEIYVQVYGNIIDTRLYVNKNNASDSSASQSLGYVRADPADDTVSLTASCHFERGDYVAVRIGGQGRGDQTYANQIQIKKV